MIKYNKSIVLLLGSQLKDYEEMTQKEFAEKYKVSQSSLAKILGMSQQNLFNYEQSIRNDHVVRYYPKTGRIEYVRLEQTIASGKREDK